MTRIIAFLVVIVVCGGCEGESGNALNTLPTPTPTAPTLTAQAASQTIAAQIEGRAIDADFEKPIPGAHITVSNMCHQDRCGPADQPYSAVADMDGYFRLTANLWDDFDYLTLRIANPGFEPTHLTLRPGPAIFFVLKAYRSITIRPGEAVQLRVFDPHYTCGDEGFLCRRINVEARADESIDLEVLPVHTQDAFGVTVVPFVHSTPPLRTRLTVRGGAAWILRGDSSGTGLVTVVARR